MAKLKKGIAINAFGYNSTPIEGEVDQETKEWLIESGRCTKSDFEEEEEIKSPESDKELKKGKGKKSDSVVEPETKEPKSPESPVQGTN
jgi:hypothetical protein